MKEGAAFQQMCAQQKTPTARCGEGGERELRKSWQAAMRVCGVKRNEELITEIGAISAILVVLVDGWYSGDIELAIAEVAVIEEPRAGKA